MGIRIYYKQELRGVRVHTVQSSIDQSDTLKQAWRLKMDIQVMSSQTKYPESPWEKTKNLIKPSGQCFSEGQVIHESSCRARMKLRLPVTG